MRCVDNENTLKKYVYLTSLGRCSSWKYLLRIEQRMIRSKWKCFHCNTITIHSDIKRISWRKKDPFWSVCCFKQRSYNSVYRSVWFEKKLVLCDFPDNDNIEICKNMQIKIYNWRYYAMKRTLYLPEFKYLYFTLNS